LVGICSADPLYEIQSLQKNSAGYDGYALLQDGTSGPYPPDISNITIRQRYINSNIIHIKLSDSHSQRYEVPNIVQVQDAQQAPSDAQLKVQWSSEPFGFSVIRTDDGETVFNTTSSRLVFEDQYLELSTSVGENLFGLGEHANALKLEKKTYTLFNKDVGAVSPDRNLYGSHAFYLEIRDQICHGVFLLNSNPMDVVISDDDNGENLRLTYKTIGGIFDFYLFSGKTPADVINQYLSLFGPVYMPPYWALGWHQCRYGYHSIEQTSEVVQNYSLNNLPLDTMWNDIDYMNAYRDFTLDPVHFSVDDVQSFVSSLHANGQHYIIIVDPGIKVEDGYPAYDEGMELNLFITEPDGVTPLLGYVWPGLTYYPDFTLPGDVTLDWWSKQISQFHQTGPAFDGLWIDMNEVSNFCTGECNIDGSTHPFDNPPYVPGGVPLNQTTINLSSRQAAGYVYDLHNLYGVHEANATRIGLERLRGKRAVVISRSNYPGSGTHGGHWLGDNTSTFDDMYQSIPGTLAMNLFGVPLVGADICGFHGNTTEELCSRWMQLGSFYPFSRNHNDMNGNPQEPYVFSEQHLNISRQALLNRYTLLPYYYSLFYLAHTTGATVVRPLFFEFVTDENTYPIDRQFLLGAGLLVSPVLEQGASTVDAYFPESARWFEWESGLEISSGYHTLDAPITKIPTHTRGGIIIPLQKPALTTQQARLNPFSLLVSLDNQGSSSGYLYLDDGESLNVGDESLIINYNLQYASSSYSLVSTITQNTWSTDGVLGSVKVFGIPSTQKVTKVTVNGLTWSSSSWSIQSNNVLVVSDLKLAMNQNFKIVWFVNSFQSSSF